MCPWWASPPPDTRFESLTCGYSRLFDNLARLEPPHGRAPPELNPHAGPQAMSHEADRSSLSPGRQRRRGSNVRVSPAGPPSWRLRSVKVSMMSGASSARFRRPTVTSCRMPASTSRATAWLVWTKCQPGFARGTSWRGAYPDDLRRNGCSYSGPAALSDSVYGGQSPALLNPSGR